jgi:hypothetical protein
LAGSTLNSNNPRKVMCRCDWSLMICAYSF